MADGAGQLEAGGGSGCGVHDRNDRRRDCRVDVRTATRGARTEGVPHGTKSCATPRSCRIHSTEDDITSMGERPPIESRSRRSQ